MKTITLSSLFFLLSIYTFAQGTITFTGNAKLWGETDHSGIVVSINGVFADESGTTDVNGDYSIEYTYGCYGTLCDNALVTVSFSNGAAWTTREINLTNVPLTYAVEDVILSDINLVTEICMITHDTLSSSPKIVWEKYDNPDIDYYKISRRSDNSNYDSIGSILQSDLSIFEDINPNLEKTNTYTITPIFKDGTDGMPSTPKTSLHLTVEEESNDKDSITLNLSVSGFVDYNISNFPDSVIIYKSMDGVRYEAAERREFLALLGELDSDIQTTLASDRLGIRQRISRSHKLYYQVALVVNSCNPLQLKSDSGPFSQSLSNIAESQSATTAIVSESKDELIVWTNPAKNGTSITVPFPGNLSVVSLDGKVVFSKTVNHSEVYIPQLFHGYYKVILKGKSTITTSVVFE